MSRRVTMLRHRHKVTIDNADFCPSYFEDLEHVIEVEEILEGAIGSTSRFAPTSTFGETYFNLLNYKFEYEGDEKGDEGWQGINNDPSHFSTDNTGIFLNELSLPSFEHVPINVFHC
jgi:hypothetical protein